MYYFIFDLDETLYQSCENDPEKIIDCINYSLLEKLKKIGKIILFSNANFIHCNKYLIQLGIKDLFSVIITYDTFNIYKPNPLAYEKVIKTCGIKQTDEVFFFDDIPINLLSGYNKEWNTILIKKNYTKNVNDRYIDNQFSNINNAINYILLFLKDEIIYNKGNNK